MFRTFARALLDGDPAALRLLGPDPRDPTARGEAVARASARRVAPGTLAALQHLDARLPPSTKRADHVRQLAAGGCAAVVTGQQVGLLGGPLLTLHKAASAVAYARLLSDETGVPCVPVFWMATEDHDWDEVRRVVVLGPAGARISVELPPDPRRISIAERALSAADEARLAPVRDACPGEVAALLARHYRAGASFADAFAGLLAELFADEGLVLLDPRDPDFARAAAPLHARAFAASQPIDDALARRCAELAAAGFAPQVPPRPGASLPFYHHDGERFRLERHGDGWRLPDGTPVDPARALDGDARLVSSSTLLRPIVEDALLPTAAYVGGPAELAYLAETAALRPLFDQAPPLAVPRARFRLVDARTAARLDRLGLAPADVERPVDELLAALAPDVPDAGSLARALAGDLDARIDDAAAADPSLARAARRTHATLGRALDRFATRVVRTRARRDQDRCNAATRAAEALFPDGKPQERRYNFAGFAARAGARPLVRALVDGALPLDGKVRDIRLP